MAVRIPLEVSDRGSDSLWQRHRNTLRGLAVLAVTLLSAAAGFRIIEGGEWSWFDAFYMTVITMSTVGYSEVQPLSQAGRIFGLIVIIVGVSAFAYTFATVGEYMVAGQLRGDLQRNRTRRELGRLSGHRILVGYGHTGAVVAEELTRASTRQVVVVDIDRDAAQRACDDGFIAIVGDAGQDDVLIKAGVDRAESLVCTADPDSVAVMTVLSARTLSPSLRIVARATLPDAESKLRRAGASEVVSAHHIAGRTIAQSVAGVSATAAEKEGHPLGDSSLGLRWLQTTIPENSKQVGRTIREFRRAETSDVHIVAIRRLGSQETVVAKPTTTLKVGDTLILTGSLEAIETSKRKLESVV